MKPQIIYTDPRGNKFFLENYGKTYAVFSVHKGQETDFFSNEVAAICQFFTTRFL